jgi:hypothetical protein
MGILLNIKEEPRGLLNGLLTWEGYSTFNFLYTNLSNLWESRGDRFNNLEENTEFEHARNYGLILGALVDTGIILGSVAHAQNLGDSKLATLVACASLLGQTKVATNFACALSKLGYSIAHLQFVPNDD